MWFEEILDILSKGRDLVVILFLLDVSISASTPVIIPMNPMPQKQQEIHPSVDIPHILGIEVGHDL